MHHSASLAVAPVATKGADQLRHKITRPSLPWFVLVALALYDFLLCPVIAGWLLVRLLCPPSRGWRALAERLGHGPVRPEIASVSIWIHAVSIGELLSALPLLRLLKQRHPGWWIVLSTTQRHADALVHTQPTGADAVCLLPWDSRFCIDRALKRARPDLLVLVECELWPNLIVRCARRGVGVHMVNARLYERDFPRYMRARRFFAPILRLLSNVAAQSEADHRRFLDLGVSQRAITVTGSTKFDVGLPADWPQRLEKLHARLPGRGGPLWVLASTHPDEEEQILSRCGPLRQRFPELQFLIAPRHVERSVQIQRWAERLGMRAALWSRLPNTGGPVDDDHPDVVILDTIGELRVVLGLADLVFVGGSLVSRGGQNPIEAALYARAILMGPSVANFADIVASFVANRALVVARSADDLIQQAAKLLADTEERKELGRRGALVVLRHRGVAQANVRLLEQAVLRGRKP